MNVTKYKYKTYSVFLMKCFYLQMPPKRKAVGGVAAGGKKAKAAPATMKDASAALKAADKKKVGKKSHKPDTHCPLSNPEVLILKLHYGTF